MGIYIRVGSISLRVSVDYSDKNNIRDYVEFILTAEISVLRNARLVKTEMCL